MTGATASAKRPWWRSLWVVGAACVLVGVGLGAAGSGGGSNPTPTVTITATATVTVTSTPMSTPSESQETPERVEEEASSTPAAPEYTVSQEQAIGKAEDYLSYSAFSKSGLIDQLEFEGFSNSDAKFAVEHIAVDWNEQAAKKAKEYLDFSSFSRSGLIDQLEFDGFSAKQAKHGADSVGL